jgi:hypothetical protein
LVLFAEHLVSPRTFDALVEGFGAFASVTAVTSAFRAYLAAAAYPGNGADDGFADTVGRGVNKGLIIGVPIGIVFMVVVFLNSFHHVSAA